MAQTQPYGDPPSEDPPTLPDPEHPGKAPVDEDTVPYTPTEEDG